MLYFICNTVNIIFLYLYKALSRTITVSDNNCVGHNRGTTVPLLVMERVLLISPIEAGFGREH